MMKSAYCSVKTLNLDFNKPNVDTQRSALYYTQATRDRSIPLRPHDAFLTTCPVYVPALQKYKVRAIS